MKTVQQRLASIRKLWEKRREKLKSDYMKKKQQEHMINMNESTQ